MNNTSNTRCPHQALFHANDELLRTNPMAQIVATALGDTGIATASIADVRGGHERMLRVGRRVRAMDILAGSYVDSNGNGIGEWKG